MNNKMLQEIGSKLDVSAQDIKGVHRGYFVSNMKYYIATAIVGILTFVLGFFAGRGTCPETIGSGGGYPFAGGLFALGGEKRASKIAAFMLVVVGVFVALKAVPIFGQAMDYGAYNRNRKSWDIGDNWRIPSFLIVSTYFIDNKKYAGGL